VNVSRRVKLIIGAVIVVPVLLHLLYALWVGPLTGYYVTVGELYDAASPTKKTVERAQMVRVGGEVLAGSISWNGARGELGFTLTDGTRHLPVAYSGLAPDVFRAGVTAIVEGRMDGDGRFLAQKLFLKCPHKYVAG
jgi:cytochrome c-type biogenesis protein CcmE